MEIFKYRHLALGCGAFLASLYISYFMSNLLRILFLVASILALISLVIVFIIRRRKSTLDIFIRCAFLCFFIALAMITSLIAFQKKELKAADGNEHKIVATVTEEKYEESYEGGYIVRVENIDNEKYSFNSLLISPKSTLNKGDKIEAISVITPLENTFEHYEKSAYIDDGILVSLGIDEYTLISSGTAKESVFKRINTELSNYLFKYLNHDTASLFSSLLLGNDNLLDPSIKRDFSRLGISHVLAVSGMHITIIVTLIGLVMRFLRVNCYAKNIILILTTIFFVALTGFSDSAVRAGIMVTIAYLILLTGRFADTITALFLSVSIICLFSPFSIFSVSLSLSFLAMLGCLIGYKLARKIKIKIKNKALRYIVHSIKTIIITTLVVIGFTLPVTFSVFGSLSLLSPLANLLIAPIFNLLIYFAPILLALIGIPYVGIPFVHLAQRLSWLSLLIVEHTANFKGIVLPTFSHLQYGGMILIIVSFIVLMFIKKKHLRYGLILTLVGVFTFFGGSLINFIDKQSNVYITTYSRGTNDFIFLESENDLNVIDISKTSTTSARQASSVISSLNYSEIENYIITDYSHLTYACVNNLANNYKLKTLYLPEPITEKEKEVYDEILEITENENVELRKLEKSMELSGFKLKIAKLDTLDRSERKSVTLSIKSNNCELLYLGAGSYELFDYFSEEKAQTADIVVFGSYGPTYKVKYSYDMPYLDKAIFYGNSYDYAKDKLKEKLDNKAIITPCMPLKFRLKDNS